MPEAPHDRPAKNTPLLALAGTVHAAPDAVYESLRRRLEPAADVDVLFLADPVDRLVVLQGHWWYRGEYRVLPDEQGARVEHEIVNVAPNAHRLGAITGRDVVKASPAAFQVLLTDLVTELE